MISRRNTPKRFSDMDKLEEIKRLVISWQKHIEDSHKAYSKMGAFWSGYEEGAKDVTGNIMEIIEKED